jgi:predicted transcriptional regulator
MRSRTRVRPHEAALVAALLGWATVDELHGRVPALRSLSRVVVGTLCRDLVADGVLKRRRRAGALPGGATFAGRRTYEYAVHRRRRHGAAG